MVLNFICITGFGFVWGVTLLITYRCGVKYGKETVSGADTHCQKPENKNGGVPPPKSNANCKQNKEHMRMGVILANIDNYDGTGAGQREVRR